MIAFFVVRIATIPLLWLTFFQSINTPEWYSILLKYKFICVGSCIPLDCLNVYWFSKIVAIVIKFFRPTKSKTVENVFEENFASAKSVKETD